MSDELYKPLSKNSVGKMRYTCFQPEIRESILKMDMPLEVRGHIEDLYELISHQLITQMKQEAQMIAVKHTETWKRYDRPIEGYDIESRSYKTNDKD
jgi:hypothetical protein